MGRLWDAEKARRERVDQLKDLLDRSHQARVADIMGLTMEPAPGPDLVGWMQRTPDSLKGLNHRCLTCSPKRPGKGHWELVTRDRLAATMACTLCGVVLQTWR